MFGQPFENNFNDLQNQYLQQLEVMKKAQQAQQKTSILEEINKEVNSLSSEEQLFLSELQEYKIAKQTYEAGFMTFLGSKFNQEYIASPEGKVAAENMLTTIRNGKKQIQSQAKAKEEKINTLLKLIEQDPEIKKRLDEKLIENLK